MPAGPSSSDPPGLSDSVSLLRVWTLWTPRRTYALGCPKARHNTQPVSTGPRSPWRVLCSSYGWIVSGSVSRSGLIMWLISGRSRDQDCCSVCGFGTEDTVHCVFEIRPLGSLPQRLLHFADLPTAEGFWAHVPEDSPRPGCAQRCTFGAGRKMGTPIPTTSLRDSASSRVRVACLRAGAPCRRDVPAPPVPVTSLSLLTSV